ncbi:MAG TPA: FGGY-family carbohydrate kinase, partial [Pirellulaceae bacterium]
ALEWFANALCPELEGAKQSVLSLLDQEAAAVRPGAQGLFFLPYLAGERTPHADPLARGCFVGLTLHHSRGHLTRSILEGVGFALRDSLEILRGLDVPVRRVRMSGGGARSELWRQVLADQLGCRVRTLRAEEGPAFGVALLAAVAAGEYRDIREACAATIQTASENRPDPSARREYNQRFPVFQQLYRSLREDFRRISELT